MSPNSHIELGNGVVLCSDSKRTALGVSRPVILRTLTPSALISIGDEVGLSGTVVCSAYSVHIGDRCLIGADVIICDTDFHPVDCVPRRHEPIPEPISDDAIHIGNDVFIGARSTILKGTTIGDGAVVGAGSLVSGDVPAWTVYAGIPARLIRYVDAKGI
nr:acyltransferase [Kocuria sp. WN036]